MMSIITITFSIFGITIASTKFYLHYVFTHLHAGVTSANLNAANGKAIYRQMTPSPLSTTHMTRMLT